jgi:hypothetical protein
MQQNIEVELFTKPSNVIVWKSRGDLMSKLKKALERAKQARAEEGYEEEAESKPRQAVRKAKAKPELEDSKHKEIQIAYTRTKVLDIDTRK